VDDYDDASIREALHKLERRGFARLASGRGSRAPKYRHLLRDALPMGADEEAVMCVLMLRGAQTPGELKQRTERMHPFAGLAAVAQTLERLITRGLTRRLDRRPGQKEERYCELLTGEGESESENAPAREADGSEAVAAITGGPESAARGANGPLSEAATVTAPAPEVSIEEFEQLRARVERLERKLEALEVTRANDDVEVGGPGQEPRELEVN
jgi:uncharacterized protein YceH (UPF0502 family)